MKEAEIKNSTPLFSVLIANYNNGQYLEECLQSVFDQTYTNWEIIIVDDGSTDIVSKVIYDKIKDKPKIRVFFNERNMGCGATKRRCVDKAKGTICGFLDPDDTITPNALEIMVNKHVEYPKHSLVYSTHYICDENLKSNLINIRVKQIGDKGYFCDNNAQVSHFATFKNEAYKKTSGIDPYLRRAVDQDLYYKLDEIGRFLFIDEPLYYYRMHENGISTATNEIKARYWHLKVIEETYRRRRDGGYPYNISQKKIRSLWESYFIRRLYVIIRAKNIDSLSTYYNLLLKSVWIRPFSEKFILKLKLGLIPIRRLLKTRNLEPAREN